MNKRIDSIWRKIAFWKYKNIQIELSEEELKNIKMAANLRNMNIDQFVEIAVQESIDKMDKNNVR